MSGITILTQHPIVEYVGQVWVILAIIAFILTISFLIASLVCNSFECFGYFVVFLITFFVFAIIGKVQYKPVETGRYEYQVLLDETVDINELASRYDIIGQDGLIWTIQDKEPIE